jgi:integrase/recombinase XerC
MATSIRRVQVIKRPGGRSPYWYLRYWVRSPEGGKPKECWKSTRTAIREQADEQRHKLERQLEAGAADEPSTSWGDFREAVEKHIAQKPGTTIGVYRNALNVFEKLVRPSDLATITPAVIENFAQQRLRDGLAPATVNRDLRHLKAALRGAVRRGLLPAAPDFHGVFVREPKKSPVAIPEEDFLRLIRAVESKDADLRRRDAPWWRMFLYVAYYLGLRRGESLALRWEDIRWETREVRVQAFTSKGRKERILPIAARLTELLASYWSSDGSPKPSEPVFPWPYDTARPLYDDWKRILLAAELPDDRRYTLNQFRSSCATALIASNVPTVVVKDFLGHSSVTTTDEYYVDTEPSMRAVAEAREIKLTVSMDYEMPA